MNVFRRLKAGLTAALLAGMMYLGASQVHAQDFNHYELLKCAGPIPSDVLKSTAQKVQAKIDKIDPNKSKKDKKAETVFYMNSGMFLDELMRSGMALFGDPVTNYLNQVKNYLLRDDKTAREQIRVYTLRSTMVNAFTTEQGVVLVSMGLLARLHNEAELALVLCHEFQHYFKKHGLKKMFKVAEEVRNGGRRISMKELDEMMENTNMYSREMESEADMEGLKMYMKSSYAHSAVNSLFEVLRTAAQPHGTHAFDYAWLENDNFVLPKRARLDSVAQFTAITAEKEDSVETNRTHPGTFKRAEAMNAALQGTEDPGLNFVFGEEQFAHIQKIARFECAGYQVLAFNYLRALYSIYQLDKTYPGSFYLQKLKAHCLYGLSRMGTEEIFESQYLHASEVKGELQRVYQVFWKLKPWETNLLAQQYVMRMYQHHSADEELHNMMVSLLVDSKLYYQASQKKLKTVPMSPAGRDSALTISEKEPKPSPPVKHKKKWFSRNKKSTKRMDRKARKVAHLESYVEKERKARTERIGMNPKGSLLYAMGGMQKGADYVALQKEAETRLRERETERKKYSGMHFVKYYAAQSQLFSKPRSMIILNQSVLARDPKLPTGIDYAGTEELRRGFYKGAQEACKDMGVKGTVMDVTVLKEGDVDRFNEIVTINMYTYQFKMKLDMTNVMHTEARIIGQKYGTDKLVLNGIELVRDRKNFIDVVTLVGLSVLTTGLYTPLLIYYLTRPPRYVAMSSVMFDLNKDEINATEYYQRYVKKDKQAGARKMIKLLLRGRKTFLGVVRLA